MANFPEETFGFFQYAQLKLGNKTQMHQIINTVDTEMPFGNPANLVNIADATRCSFNIRL